MPQCVHTCPRRNGCASAFSTTVSASAATRASRWLPRACCGNSDRRFLSVGIWHTTQERRQTKMPCKGVHEGACAAAAATQLLCPPRKTGSLNVIQYVVQQVMGPPLSATSWCTLQAASPRRRTPLMAPMAHGFTALYRLGITGAGGKSHQTICAAFLTKTCSLRAYHCWPRAGARCMRPASSERRH